MLKPRLMNPQFVQKMIQEKNDKIFQFKNFIHSKHFYIFLFVFALCMILFLIYKYFDKKRRVEEEEIKKEEKNDESEMIDENDYHEDDEIGATPIRNIKSQEDSTYIPNHIQKENDMMNLDEYDDMEIQEIQF
jgi:flagellar biosynthesis/type III secretory pathway M-ring protein FliF/YscJ